MLEEPHKHKTHLNFLNSVFSSPLISMAIPITMPLRLPEDYHAPPL